MNIRILTKTELEGAVHLFIYTKDIYEKLGFTQIGDIKKEDERKYIPMEYKSY